MRRTHGSRSVHTASESERVQFKSAPPFTQARVKKKKKETRKQGKKIREKRASLPSPGALSALFSASGSLPTGLPIGRSSLVTPDARSYGVTN
eukprot:9083330-Pyramimonas_sp.AAC.1